MLASAPAIAFVPSTDLDRSRLFSVDVLGLAPTETTPFGRHEGMDQDGAGVWRTPAGDQVAWFRDPDGNTLWMTQFAA
ncbi:MAG TPA: hypothetical protein VH561_11235 [Micromonosporaceae bacterium]|jgi:catechol 2,3-dioxygenase-like lactoylglutathione lyase family enzyme